MDDVAEADEALLRGDTSNAAAAYAHFADRGDVVALQRAAVTAAGGLGRAQSWPDAIEYTVRGAEAGDGAARRVLALLARQDGENWRALGSRIDMEAFFKPPLLTRLSSISSIGACQGFIPAPFCDWLVERARDRLAPATVNDTVTGEQGPHPMRTATTCAFGPFDRDLIVCALQERAARLCQVPVAQHEAPNVISYLPGQQFALHSDFVEPSVPGFADELRIIGQRILTFVTYLNDDFEGAPTHFPALKLDFRGGKGDAVVFSNVLPDGAPHRNTIHAGMPPTSGRKWVLSQWIRSKPMAVR